MRSDTRARPAGLNDPNRNPARAAALHRLSTVLAPDPATPASGAPETAAPEPAADLPWANPDPEGIRPDRIPPEDPDPGAWADPPWWARVRWAPDRLAGVALVVLVLALGGFSVHRLLASVPDSPAVPDLPLASPGETVPPDGVSPSGNPAQPDDQVAPVAAETSGATDPTSATEAPGDGVAVVSVVGLVGRSGLVTLPPGARVADALEAAGGVLEGGDRDGLNLARKVADGEQILVGLAPGPDGPQGPRSDIVGPDSGPGSGSAQTGGGAAGGAADSEPGLVDLNTADATELESLPGVGPVTASSIVAWREANGTFSRTDQLAEVDGIGPATLARLRPLVTV